MSTNDTGTLIERPDLPSVGWATKFSLLMALLTALPAALGPLFDDAEPLGLPPHYWVYTSMAIAIAIIVVRQLQAALAKWQALDPSDPSLGLSTYLGYGMSVLAGIPAALAELDAASQPLNVDPSVWLKATAILTVVTTAGRGLQALSSVYAKWNGGGVVVEPPPEIPSGAETPPPIEHPPPPPGEE